MYPTDPGSIMLDHALKIALGMSCDATKAEALEGIALAYAEVGQPARAASILHRVWQMARGMPDPSDQTSQLRWLEACVEAGLEDLAVAVASEMAATCDRAGVYTDLAKFHAKAGHAQRATAYLTQALELATAAAQAGEDSVFTLRELAETSADLGLTEQAVQVASAPEQDGMAIQALYAVAVHCALAGWHAPVAAIFDRALQRVATLASPDDRAHRVADLVKSRVQAGLLDHTPALRVAQAIEHPAARAQALVAIAASCADLGERDRALAAVDHAFATARTIQADEAGAKVLAAVADLYRQVGARERAAEVRRLAQTWAATRRRSTSCSGSRIPTPEHGRWSGP